MFQVDKQTTPEERLIYAIFLQAYRDLFINIKEPNGPDNLNRDQAISFFTNRSGALAAHRNHLCSLIGWDGDVLAYRIRAMLDGDDFPLVSTDASPAVRQRHAKSVARLREHWSSLRGGETGTQCGTVVKHDRSTAILTKTADCELPECGATPPQEL